MKEVVTENLQERWKVDSFQPKTEKFEKALSYCVDKVRENLAILGDKIPKEVAPDGIYEGGENCFWTAGFWPGMIWIAYAVTGDKGFLAAGKRQSASFKQRLEADYDLQHHDIGFLYSPSSVADYILTGDEEARQVAIDAAYRMTKMYRMKAGIIQRGGDMEDLTDKFTGVFIVDCMNNVPLLFWAAKETGDKVLYDMALNHMKHSVDVLIQKNGAICQSGVANVKTGEIVCDFSLAQGKGGADAAWGRGQAWAIAGLPVTYDYTKDPEFLEAAKPVVNFFLNRMPSDLISDWDLYYTDDETQRDTSASAIAVCGLLEIADYLPDGDEYKAYYRSAAYRILESLIDNYQTKEDENSMGLLNAGVYGMSWKGVDMPNIFGDYYYMEALYRVCKDFKRFW